MAKEAVYVGVDVTKRTLDVAVSDAREVRQFTNDHEGIILEATGHLEMPLAAALQADHLSVAIINPRQVHDCARATGALAKTDAIDAWILVLLGILFALKFLLLVPHIIVLYFLSLIRFIIVWFAYWVVLIAGRYPRGMFDFVVGATRWETRVNLWMNGIVDRYPPFSLD